MNLPQRKPTQIPNFDYGKQNYYFVTVCTNQKKCIFWDGITLNGRGKIAEECLIRIPGIYDGVRIDKFTVMPNHIHAIIALEGTNSSSLTQIVGKYKAAVTKQIHLLDNTDSVWQRSFHDHIIRNQEDYERIWLYIHGNPQRWDADCFYTAEEI